MINHTPTGDLVLETDVDANDLALYAISDIATLTFSSPAIAGATLDPAIGTGGSPNTVKYTALAAGYYLIEVTAPGAAAAVTLSYPSEPYACPAALTNHTDVYNIFEPCVFYSSYFQTGSVPYIDTNPVFLLTSIALREVIEIQLNFIDPPTAA